MSRRVVAIVAAALLSGGCGEGEEAEGPAAGAVDTVPGDTLSGGRPGAGSPSEQDTLPERPATRADTIFVEGMPEVTELTLVRSPAGFEPAFSTYVPEEMVPVFTRPDRGLELRFVAAFGGVRNEEASLGILVYPPDATEEEVLTEARRVAETHGASGEPARPGRWEWSRIEYPLGDVARARVLGTVAVGRHVDRWFRILLRYPPEYGDGFAPRADLILEEWRWGDTGRGLAGEFSP